MQTIDSRTAFDKSGSVRMFSALAWPLFWAFLAFIVLGGSAFAYLYCSSVPKGLAFDSVFSETPSGRFDKDILDEINRDDILLAYKRSLIPEHPVPARRVFFATTKPLGDYCSGRHPRAFVGEVRTSTPDLEMKVHLFLRQESNDGPIYQILPSSAESHTFSVPAGHSGDRLIAIGRIGIPGQGSVGELAKLVHLEVVSKCN